MSKSTVTKLFFGGVIAVIAGAILAIAAIWIAIANDVFVMNGQDISAISGGAAAWATLGVALVGAIATVAGLISGLASWIGALLNTWQLTSRSWFVGLLLLGIFNFGLLAMLAYVVAGPDGTSPASDRRSQLPSAALAA